MHYKHIIILIFTILGGLDLTAQNVNDLLDQAWENLELKPTFSLELLDKAILKSVQTGDKEAELEALEMKGIVYDELNFSNKAVEIYLEVLKRRKEQKDTLGIVSPLMNLGVVYQKLERYTEAEKFLLEARDLATKKQDTSWIVAINANLGINFSRLKQYAKAEQLFKQTISMSPIDSLSIYNLKTNLALAYQRKGDIEEALELNKEVLKFYESKSRIAEGNVRGNLGRCYALLKEYDKARSYALQAHLIAQENGYTNLAISSSRNLSRIFEEIGEFEQALEWSQTTMRLTEQLDSTRNAQYITTLNTVYELDQKNSDIAKLKVEKSERTKRMWQVLSGAIAVVLLLLLILLRNRLKLQKQESARKIEQQENANRAKELALYKVQLNEKTNHLLERNRLVTQLEGEVSDLKQKRGSSEEIQELLTNKILTQQDWEGYKKTYNMVYSGFFTNLETRTPDLTTGEQRTAALMRLDLSNIETGEILGISERSVIQNKYRLRKKFKLETNDQLFSLLCEL